MFCFIKLHFVSGIFGTFCGPCLVCKNADRTDKLNPVTMLLACFCPCIPLFIMREKVRDENNIEGSIFDDLLAVCCCPSCSNCQLAKEIDFQNSRCLRLSEELKQSERIIVTKPKLQSPPKDWKTFQTKKPVRKNRLMYVELGGT